MLKLINVKLAYSAGGRTYTVTTAESRENRRAALDVILGEDRFCARVRVLSPDRPIVMERLSAEFEYEPEKDSRVFLNGYQSWTDSIEHDPFDKMRGIDHIPRPVLEKYAFSQYGDYSFAGYSHRRGVLHGFGYGYIKHRNGEFEFIGSLNENEAFTIIRTDAEKKRITVSKDCKGVRFCSGFGGIDLCFLRGSENYVFDEYFRRIGVRPLPAGQLFGYTSWYRHYQDISQSKLEKDLAGLVNSEHKADVFQIDDGYQTAVGDWLSIDKEKFPEGLGPIAESIREKGLVAGLWLAPFVCEKKSFIYRSKPQWLLKDKNGEPVRGGSNWSGFYALDIYNEEFRAYLREVFDTVVKEWGFRLLKLDFLYAACLIPREDKTRAMVMADGMDLLRELCGEARILGCGVPMTSAFGKVEYCRIGCDISLDWDDKPYMRLMHRERTSTKNCILNSVFRRQLNGRAFINDPDVFLLRDTDNTMTDDEKLCLAEVNSLAGGVLFTSDNFDEYDEDKRQILDNMLSRRSCAGGIVSADLEGSTLRVVYNGDGAQVTRIYRACF